MKINVTRENMSFEDAFRRFILHKRAIGCAEGTLETYVWDFRKFCRYIDPRTSCSGLQTRQIQDVMNRIADEGLARNTIRHYSATLSSFLSWAREEGLTDAHCQLYHGEETVPATYSEADLKKLLRKPNMKTCDFPEFRNWVIVSLLINNGIRAATVRAIQNRDLHLDEGVIYLRHTKRKKALTIPLCPALVSSLAEYVGIRKGQLDEPLFVNENGTPMTESGLQSAIQRYNRSRGVSLGSLHAFRHTFARMYLVDCKGDALMLQKLLGHETLDMTRHYVKLFDADIVEDFKTHSPLERLQKMQKIKLLSSK